ncbi:hypothetical protein [Bradyrhizobium sp. HKCCYLRH3061]|uniref:hypothetical protein n=1 Tax=Bradyrhizobium sp. HKCCYLRH3061 TaxID=3420734 RepID=UPI003EBF9929
MANSDHEGGEAAVSGVLITAPDGTIFNIPRAALDQFRVPDNEIEGIILTAENAGLVESAHRAAPTEAPSEEPTGPAPRTVINIFVGDGKLDQPVVVAQGPPGDDASQRYAAGAAMSKYAAGSTMSKYAAGSTMSKYAAGSSMSKFAAGSTMSKFAAGSTMSKYAAGSAMAPRVEQALPFAVFYGRWIAGG